MSLCPALLKTGRCYSGTAGAGSNNGADAGNPRFRPGAGLTFSQAEELCAQDGRRLCRAEELARGVCCATSNSLPVAQALPQNPRLSDHVSGKICGHADTTLPFWVWTSSLRTYQELTVTRRAARNRVVH